MKKIMQINITCGRGSTGKLAQALYTAAQEQGDISLFAYSAFTPTLADAFSIETTFQNYLRRGLNRAFGRKQIHSTPGTRRLIRHIRKEKPDLIHLHNIHLNAVNYPMLFSYLKEAAIPVVYTLHDCWLFTGGCVHYPACNCDRYQTGCEDCPSTDWDDIAHSRPEIWQTKRDLIGGNDNLYPVCVSDWLKQSAENSYMGQMKHRPERIYNGVNLELFHPGAEDIRAQYGIPKNTFLILGVADRWTEAKGLQLLQQCDSYLEEDSVIVLVGDCAENLQIPCRNLMYVGRTRDQEQLVQWYCAADVFVNPSSYETFGMTTAEALACGTPAVVMNVTACPELVDGHTGLVVRTDPQDLIGALREIRGKGKAAYTEACTARAKALFDEKRMVQEYLDLYRRILDDGVQKSATE